jgi:hypothetical protein
LPIILGVISSALSAAGCFLNPSTPDALNGRSGTSVTWLACTAGVSGTIACSVWTSCAGFYCTNYSIRDVTDQHTFTSGPELRLVAAGMFEVMGSGVTEVVVDHSSFEDFRKRFLVAPGSMAVAVGYIYGSVVGAQEVAVNGASVEIVDGPAAGYRTLSGSPQARESALPPACAAGMSTAGRFCLEPAPVGLVHLKVSATGYATAELFATVPDERGTPNTSVIVRLTPVAP